MGKVVKGREGWKRKAKIANSEGANTDDTKEEENNDDAEKEEEAERDVLWITVVKTRLKAAWV